MSDAREALVALILERFRAAETYMDLPRQAGLLADAILAAGWTPPTVKPSVEDVARAILMVTQAADVDPDYAWNVQYPEVQDECLDQARAVLALFPGRAEAEVKAEALREAAQFLRGDMDEPWGDRAANRLDTRADRIARGEGS